MPHPLMYVLIATAGACASVVSDPPAAQLRGPAAPAAQQRFFDWTDLRLDAAVYAGRRGRLMAELAAANGDVFLVASAVGRSLGGTFRQLDDFEYLTGLEIPDSVLAFDVAENRITLYLPERDARFESSARPNDFPGRPLGQDPELARRSGLPDLRPAPEFAARLAGWDAAKRRVQLPLRDVEIPASEAGWVHPRTPVESLAVHLAQAYPGLELQSGLDEIAALRSVKSPEEVEIIREACRITSAAIRHAAGFVRDGIDERGLEAELEAAFKRQGAQRPAFDSIIKSGPNSLWPWRILAAQYDRRNRVMHDGDLVIFDVGCELDHYASDVGRTFPVSGHFTPEQRAALEMITSVSDVIIAAVRPDITLRELQQIAVDAIPEVERPYMQTSLFFGHPIGLNVGDPMPDGFVLRPGTIFTIEPWYYDHDRELAVFVEDNVLVTDHGCENLTAGLPRSPDELERLTGHRAR